MQPTPGTWADVKDGGFIRSKADVVYKVIRTDAGWVTLRPRTGDDVYVERPKPHLPVTLMTLTPEETRAALGGTWID